VQYYQSPRISSFPGDESIALGPEAMHGAPIPRTYYSMTAHYRVLSLHIVEQSEWDVRKQ